MHSNHIIALNFSDFSLEAVLVDAAKGGYTVQSYSRGLLESGVIENGKIINEDKLREAVTKLFQQAQPAPLQPSEIAITIPESRTFAQVFSLPRSADKHSVPALLWQSAKENFPLDQQLMVADFYEISRGPQTVDYLFVATYKDSIEEYRAFFQKLRIKVTVMTVESLAVAAAAVDGASNEAVLLLDIGARTTVASIFKGHALQDTVNINIGGNKITAALAEKLQMSVADAEQHKVEANLTAGGGNGSDMLIIQGQLQPLKDEVMTFIKYFEGRSGTAISRVLLTGGTAALTGIDEYFSSNIGLPVSIATTGASIAVPFDQPAMSKFLLVVGLAVLVLSDKGVINFLSHKDKDWEMRGPRIAIKKMKLVNDATSGGSKVSRRTVILFIIMLLVANVVAWLWWSNRHPQAPTSTANVAATVSDGINFIIKPFRGYDTAAAPTLSFSFFASIAKQPLPGDLVAKEQTITLEKIMEYDQGTVDYVSRQLGSHPTDEMVQQAMQDYLADALWQANLADKQQEQHAQGAVLLDSYVSKKIVTADAAQHDPTNPTIKQRITVSYQAVVLSDGSAFNALESSNTAAFAKVHPQYTVSVKTFLFEPADSERTRVSAVYEFKPQL